MTEKQKTPSPRTPGPEETTEEGTASEPTPLPVAGEDEAPGATEAGDVGAEAAAPGLLAQAEETLEGWAGQLLPRSWGVRARRATSTIFVDEYRDATDWVVEAELPGVDPDRDVTLRLDRHALRLEAERPSPAAARAASDRRELREGRLSRTLPVPRGVDPARAKAEYRDGILTVRVPLAPDDAGSARELTVTRG